MKQDLFQPLNYTAAGAVCQGQQYILVKAIDEPKPHISVMLFTAGKVVLEEVGDKSADTYFSVEVTPYGALVPHEERIVVGHRSSERAVDSTFFFEFSPERFAELNGILVGDDAVAKFYAAIGRPVPEWLVSSVVNTRRVQRPGVLGATAYHQLA
ncbi:MAG: hypothetical protein KBD19_02310 [Candidatus Moranbacteria bacterium]|nr:hypothetical protein [Candidatus Moranbacteria bacterium]